MMTMPSDPDLKDFQPVNEIVIWGHGHSWIAHHYNELGKVVWSSRWARSAEEALQLSKAYQWGTLCANITVTRADFILGRSLRSTTTTKRKRDPLSMLAARLQKPTSPKK